MSSSTGLRALANISSGRMDRDWLISIRISRAEFSTSEMSPEVVLVASVPRSTDLLTRSRHGRVAVKSFIGGLGVFILASGSEVSGFDRGQGRWIFSERKNSEYDFLRKGSNAVGPVP